jgi:hypothetical protein
MRAIVPLTRMEVPTNCELQCTFDYPYGDCPIGVLSMRDHKLLMTDDKGDK